jgi:exosortase/archaeosortase family protein
MLLLSVPLPDSVWGVISQSLKSLVTGVATDLLNILQVAARQQGSVIITARGSVGVDEACSGLRSLQASLVAGLFIGLLTLRKRRHQALLLLLSVGIVLAANTARATFLAWKVGAQGPEILTHYHDPAGFAILLVNMGILALVSAWLVYREKHLPPLKAQPIQLTGAGEIWRFDEVLALALLLLLLASHLVLAQRTYWQVSGPAAFLGTNPQIVPGYQAESLPTTRELAEMLRYDGVDSTRLISGRGTAIEIFHALWFAGKVSNQFVGQHVPAICYQNSGWTALGPAEARSVVLRGREWPMLWQEFRQGNETVRVGFLHVVGGRARVFRPEDRGLFSWRTLRWDVGLGKLAPQEIFIIALEQRGEAVRQWQELLALLRQRYP